MSSGATSNDLIEEYLTVLKGQRQLAKLTIDAYRYDLSRLLTLLSISAPTPARAGNSRSRLSDDEKPTPDLLSVTEADIRRSAAQLRTSGMQPRSIARVLSAWRSFYRWLGEHYSIALNPVITVRPPRRSKPLPKALNATQAIQLVSQAAPDANEQPIRSSCDTAMFELLYSSGLRVSELASLDFRYHRNANYASDSWLDSDSAEVIVTGKGDKQRAVPVGQPALEAIARWLTLRTSIVGSDSHPALFISERGKRLSRQTIYSRLRKHTLALGMPIAVHPHMLRHSFATHMLQGSGDLRAVQELLGHKSIASTQVYTSLDFQRLAQVYDAAHPRSRAKKSS